LTYFKLGENYTYSKGDRKMRHVFKVIKSNIEIAITTPQIARFR